MKKFTLCLKISLLSAFCMFLCAFSDPESMEQYAIYLHKTLTDHYDSSQESDQVKRYELNVTNNGFCRYRKIYNSGKQELFAFNLSSFKTMDYYGNGTRGELYLRTKRDDVIVQTRNDKKGDIDSMGTYLVIPLKNIEITELNALSESFQKFNAALVAQK